MAEPEHRQRWSRVGPYQIERRLGTGGMGVVYLARHEAFGTVAAVKLLRPEFVADPRLQARLRREVDAAGRVPRSCTASVLGADLEADPPWLATEYIEGPTLDVALLERGRLRGSALKRFAAGVAVALRAIHEHGVIHRDLKPTNVLLSPVGPRVIDFGIARVEQDGTELTQLTAPGAVVGTPAYMAPEQLRGEELTTAVDIFAWGSLVAYAATGRPPFGSGKPVLRAILRDPPDLDGLPRSLRRLVLEALDKEPARRPSAAELVQRLSRGAPQATTEVLATAAEETTMVPAGSGGLVGTIRQRLRRASDGRLSRAVRWGVGAAAAMGLLVATAAVVANVRGEPPPLAGASITVGVFHGWPEGIAATFLWKAALEHRGAEVQIRFADVAAVYREVAEGELDLAFDAWLPSVHLDYWTEYGDQLEDLGAWYTGAGLAIAVNDDAPIRSLAEFADHADEFDNRLVGIEAGAGLTRITEESVIPAYGLREAGIRLEVSSTDSMLNELRGAIARGNNVAVTLWEPHWLYDTLAIRNLADPANAFGGPDNIHAFARPGFSGDYPQVADWVGSFAMVEEELRDLEMVVFFEHLAATDEEYEIAVGQWLQTQPGYLAQLTQR